MSDPRSPTSIRPALAKPPTSIVLPPIAEAATPTEPQSPAKCTLASRVGDSLLRGYAPELGSPDTTEGTLDESKSKHNDSQTSASSAVDSCNAASLPASPTLASAIQSSSFQAGHKRNALSVESIPQQTIMKALASARRNQNPHNLSLASTLSGMIAAQSNTVDNRPGTASSQQPS